MPPAHRATAMPSELQTTPLASSYPTISPSSFLHELFAAVKLLCAKSKCQALPCICQLYEVK